MAMNEAAMTEVNTAKSRRPVSPRRRRYWTTVALAALTGFLAGSWLLQDRPEGRNAIELIGNGPLSATFAIGAAIFWVVGMAVCMSLYHRSIDDHEEQAWLRAGLVGSAPRQPAPSRRCDVVVCRLADRQRGRLAVVQISLIGGALPFPVQPYISKRKETSSS